MKKRTTTKKLMFRTQYSENTYKGKIMDTTLLTQPDQNMSIKDLLDRHSRGLPLGATEQKGEYFDTEIPRFDDILDAVEYKKSLIQKQKDLETKIKADQESAKQKEKQMEQKLAPKPTEKSQSEA
tara:strand:+ start:2753 stop:3127 length:375 start_codon:yes stop_codon:yes gene_type:complete